jgi:hypothetical protein
MCSDMSPRNFRRAIFLIDFRFSPRVLMCVDIIRRRCPPFRRRCSLPIPLCFPCSRFRIGIGMNAVMVACRCRAHAQDEAHHCHPTGLFALHSQVPGEWHGAGWRRNINASERANELFAMLHSPRISCRRRMLNLLSLPGISCVCFPPSSAMRSVTPLFPPTARLASVCRRETR